MLRTVLEQRAIRKNKSSQPVLAWKNLLQEAVCTTEIEGKRSGENTVVMILKFMFS